LGSSSATGSLWGTSALSRNACICPTAAPRLPDRFRLISLPRLHRPPLRTRVPIDRLARSRARPGLKLQLQRRRFAPTPMATPKHHALCRAVLAVRVTRDRAGFVEGLPRVRSKRLRHRGHAHRSQPLLARPSRRPTHGSWAGRGLREHYFPMIQTIHFGLGFNSLLRASSTPNHE
jgi:hypothetical protein